ncbi:MAG: NlpC/P60 family protein [Nocardioides sp.]
MTNPRVRLTSVLAGCALAATVGLIPSAPAQAEPEIKDVQARVDTLFHEAEQASERYNDAKIELAELNEDLAALRADQGRESKSLDGVRTQARDAILRQYAGTSLSAVGEVLAAGDPGEFLEQVSTMSSYQRLQQGLFDNYRTGLKALSIRRDATLKRLEQVTETEEQLAAEKATISDKLADAKQLLGRLEADERREVLSRGTETAPSDLPTAPVSGRASAAVSYAMAQIGDSYVYGAAGPSAFDCSGLTMMAWAQAGVALPHSSGAQFNSGTRVAASDLIPGDLVFYYSPISHVGMYIGNGMIAHAANPSTDVAVAGLYSMPYVGAVRPG